MGTPSNSDGVVLPSGPAVYRRRRRPVPWWLPEFSKLAYWLPVAETRTPYQVAPGKLSIMQMLENLSPGQRITLLAVNDDMPDHKFPPGCASRTI
jgi:hypothetical protein